MLRYERTRRPTRPSRWGSDGASLCTCTLLPRSPSASPHAPEPLAGGHYRVLVRPQVAESSLLPARWRLIGMSVSVLAGVLAALIASHITL